MNFVVLKQNMENRSVKAPKEGQEKDDSSHGLRKDGKLSIDMALDLSELNSERFGRRANGDNTLIVYLNQLQTNKIFVKDLALLSHGLGRRIPKHMVSLDEKYLRCCLESIHFSASKAVPCNINVNLSPMRMGAMFDGLSVAKTKSRNEFDSSRFVFEYPLAAGDESVMVRYGEQWIVGSIMGSKSMTNILKSPLINQLGALDSGPNFGRKNSNDVKCLKDFMNYPGGSSSRDMLEKETPILGIAQHGSKAIRERLLSMSSTNSTCSDQSSSSATGTVSQGMLHYSWEDGNPNLVFSVEDGRKVYVAKLLKAETAGDEVLDCVYYFHSRRGGEREHMIQDNESHLIGKMKVSTSITLCPNSSNILETEFVLFANNDNYVQEMHPLSNKIIKNKGLSKKMADVFKSSYSTKQRTLSKDSGSSAILEYCPWVPYTNSDALQVVNLLENDLPPNLELAAIIVKEQIPDSQREKLGGWGLKFLKKVVKQTNESPEASTNTSGSTISMDILVPSGLHGGPRSRNCGPSSLIDRWKSGGQCDCGGWDIGCPLTVLKTRSSKEEEFFLEDTQGKCKSSELFIQGSECSTPTLRMVNIQEGLYLIHFQSTLSALQSFSIASALIHAQTPTLRPRSVQKIK